MWRGECEFWTRVVLSWMFNLFIYFVCAVASLTYGIIKFQGAATNFMLIGWGVAACQTYLVLEPLQIIIIVFLPCIVSEETRCGRCCLRIKFWYNELFTP